MKLNFIVATDQPDSQGDIINIDGVMIDNPIVVLKEFDHNQPLGKATVTKDGGKLRAEFEMKEDFLSGTGLSPSIGFQLIKSKKGPDGIRELQEIKLYCVGICANENVDPNVTRF